MRVPITGSSTAKARFSRGRRQSHVHDRPQGDSLARQADAQHRHDHQAAAHPEPPGQEPGDTAADDVHGERGKHGPYASHTARYCKAPPPRRTLSA